MKRLITISLAVMALFAVSCDDNNSVPGPDDTIPVEDLVPRKDIELTRSQAEYVKTGGNEFALNLFKEVAGDETMVISPLSVTFALGMVDNGALGNTKSEIEKVLGYGEESVDGLNSFCKTMMEGAQEIDPSSKIEFANAAVVNSASGKLKEEFKSTIKANYSAEISNVVFGEDPVKDFINNWCTLKTHGMIPELLSEEPRPAELAVFLNAVYFKGIWSSQFKKADSKEERFLGLDGKHKMNMMHQKAHFNYTEIKDVCKAVSLPFGNQAYNMLFILPATGSVKSFNELKESLNPEFWNKINTALHDEEVDVKIPSFETEFNVELIENLKQLGIHEAFNPFVAQFGLMSDAQVGITRVLQKAKIIVDEQGSEAAAATAVFMSIGANLGGETNPTAVEFHADHPFIYAITEVSTGAIFFIGQFTGKQ